MTNAPQDKERPNTPQGPAISQSPAENKITPDPWERTNEESTAAELSREFRWLEFCQFAINGVLAIIGVVALCIYHGQLTTMNSQLKEMIRQYPELQKSADAAHDAAVVARDTLMLDQRPWVGLMGSNHFAAQIEKGSPIKISLDFQNVGKTPALNEFSVNHFSNHPIRSPMPNFDDCSKKEAGAPITLMPNAIANVNITTDTPGSAGIPIIITDADLDLLSSEKVQLFIYGCVWYDDTFGIAHRTDYCLQYIPLSKKGGSANSFTACPTHNHAN
jgi:hypothetical protein